MPDVSGDPADLHGDDDGLPLCGAEDIAVTVRWEQDGTGLRGQAASARAQVSWRGGAATADVQGPVQPGCAGQGPGNLSSGWFNLVD